MSKRDHNGTVLNKLSPLIYMGDKLLQKFQEDYFDRSVEYFKENQRERDLFLESYEEMQVMIEAVREFTFQARLVMGFSEGCKTEIVNAHIESEAEMESWIENHPTAS